MDIETCMTWLGVVFSSHTGSVTALQSLNPQVRARATNPLRLASGVWRAMLTHDDEDLATCHVDAETDEHDSESVP